MSIAELEQLLDRWAKDPIFRDAVRQDPEGEITRAGFQLNDAEWAAIRETDWRLPDEELRNPDAQCPGLPTGLTESEESGGCTGFGNLTSACLGRRDSDRPAAPAVQARPGEISDVMSAGVANEDPAAVARGGGPSGLCRTG